ncbi:hypothetical protein KKA33_04665 [Patescibacteria group bacterium]|nr:hypothetical protein [Patescibacteria group bacterium]
MGIAIVEASGKSVSPNTVMKLSQKGIVIFDFDALMQGDLSHWKKAIGGRPSFLAISQNPPRDSGAQAEIILYSGEEYDHNEVRTAIGRNGKLVEVIGMITVNFPLEHEGVICYLNREVPADDPFSETLELFTALIENITPRLISLPGFKVVCGEGRPHLVMDREWKGIIEIPSTKLDGDGNIMVDPQYGFLASGGKNGCVRGVVTHDNKVLWGNLNEPLSAELIAQALESFTPTAQA